MKVIKGQNPKQHIETGGWKICKEYGVLASPEGKSVVLEPRLSKLLYLLTSNVNEIVSRQYLINNIWAETIVNEESLTRAIADLRKVLLKNFESAPKIETIRKRGYKLALQMGPKQYAVKVVLKKPAHYAVLVGILALLTLLWYVS